MFFKRKPERDKEHLAFIRTLPCLKCFSKSVAAHLRKGTDGSISKKPSDKWTIPLCQKCHDEQHKIGEVTFWGDIDQVKELAQELYAISGDYEAALGLIVRYRNAFFN